MKYIFISTTALNRPDLHKTVFHDWYKLLNTLNYKLVHFINIDCIDKLPYSYEDTCKNFKEMTNLYNIELHILNKKEPNFFLSCLTVSKQIDTYIEINNIDKNNANIFWLEDDWILNRNITLKDYIKYLNINSKLYFESHMNWSIIRKNYIWALAPCILGYNIFKEMLDIWTKHFIMNNIKDPENCIGRSYIDKKYQTNSISMLILDDTLDKLNLNKSHFKHYFEYKNRYINDLNKITNYTRKISKIEKEKFNVIILANTSMDVGRQYMSNLNIKKQKQNNKQFVYIKINE